MRIFFIFLLYFYIFLCTIELPRIYHFLFLKDGVLSSLSAVLLGDRCFSKKDLLSDNIRIKYDGQIFSFYGIFSVLCLFCT